MNLFGLFLFQLWLETQGAGWGWGEMPQLMWLSPGDVQRHEGTDTGRVHMEIHFISSYQPIFI